MFIFVIVLISIVSILLALVVLVQNPKGGGLSAGFTGVGNQLFGASKSTDLVEKITWGLAIALMVLCLAATALLPTKQGVIVEEQPTSEIEENIGDFNFPTQALPSNELDLGGNAQ